MSKRCHFHDSWKSDLDFSSWLDVVADNVHRAYCRTYKKTFDVGSMGVAAVKSHMKSKTHASISGSAGSSTQLEVSLPTHRLSHRRVQTPAAAHCHQHRIHPLILLLSPVTSSEQRYCGHRRSLCAIIPSTVAMISQPQCFLTVVLRRLSPVEQPSAHI